MSIVFHYKEIHRPDGTKVKCPMVPVSLSWDEKINTIGLLDSGADISAMPVSMARLLGLDISGTPQKSFGIGGEIESVQSVVWVTVEKNHERYRFQLPVMVIFGKYDFPILLGRERFFSKFIVTFDQMEQKVMLKEKKIFAY